MEYVMFEIVLDTGVSCENTDGLGSRAMIIFAV